ncbi:bifunctional diaminohydroxyphosphoribosylaminopyrimidine deaminase/5-amino-6-(5-phosphoribosylamino)uracil reductase RibD [Pasteurellaceae bacterium USgator11]|nr:bifunctional diaminohydroxyphosphoribosylaminopyrimidine deaminase/5-amino-6-(5-phosphoribosylamino)uracil reductase RibD [Pasteurellaceae bacterium USgator41]TNG95083.1 bifunctional diaminohydroxyphosphoribosylaminopyrimidine deaminase/5-amino-6-(5-phosphoribosylamino)uracil reductase RibD [Pasteurellaceae bacterium UScroc12]TNG99084.1 bifunctional diaminohydroxyphosphoribosylaminopyrimidine deaminase/5-amino-6-(5-phosphoribosylamino)uracil reductase RibD [Pasteurellaceae bacterium USgator11]
MTVYFSNEDQQFMQRALALAARGRWTTAPNPMVGCVIVKDGKVIGEGYHQRAGEGHAEVNAFNACTESAVGATLYVTLEPCSHFGKTPPCALKIIENGIKKVVIAMRDPNPLVAGKGIALLQQAGIEVAIGLLASQAEALNKGFLKRMRCGRPFVQLKMAMTIDGKTATASGESKWITGEQARAEVQDYRACAGAILSASGTVLVDDPLLNVRWQQLPPAVQQAYPESAIRQPVRVIMDSKHRVRPYHKLFGVESAVWLVGAQHKPRDLSVFPDFVEAIYLDPQQHQLSALMDELAQRQINILWIEAGSNLAGSLISAGLVDELIVYIAPKLLGDQARGLCHMPDLHHLADAPQWQLISHEVIGEDIKLIYRPKHLTEEKC